MEIKTDTTTVFIIKLTEAEVRNALVDPSQITSQLRAALPPVAKSPKRGLKTSRARRDPKASARKTQAPCPKCGRIFAHPKRLLNHLQKEHPELPPTVRAAA